MDLGFKILLLDSHLDSKHKKSPGVSQDFDIFCVNKERTISSLQLS